MLPRPASDFYRAQQRRSVAAMLLARREWATMGDDFDAGWKRVGPRLSLLVASAQLGAARDGAAYVPSVLEAQGQSVSPDADVVPHAFAGVAADGRPLESLLYGSVVHARTAQVDSLAARLDVGGSVLDMLVRTSVADAGRDAAMVGATVRPRVEWVRMVNAPCCKRCAVLAGRVYRYSQAFQRHPGCDCTMIPQTVAKPDAPGLAIGPGDVKDLTRKERQAIADGADFNATVNASRKAGDYLPPTRVDQITHRARSRADAVDALVEHGYAA